MSDYQPNEAEKLLIAALRSGEYRQARKKLRRGDRFCCLGVACDIYSRETGLGLWDGDGFYLAGELEVEVLPARVAEWLGWAETNGEVIGDEDNPLSNRNDHGARFATIAKMIESGRILRSDASK